MASSPKPIISVPVRELVEFSCRSGDLGGERDFVGPSRALQGTRGHQQVQRSRPAGYQKEVRLSYDLERPDFVLRIQGRIDGLLADGPEVLLEEIKTTHGARTDPPDVLHWAQLKIYGFIYARQHALAHLTLRLTYLDLMTGRTTEHPEHVAAADLVGLFEATTEMYAVWLEAYHSWCATRDQSIRNLPFPYSQYRQGQREFAVAVYRTILKGERLFAEAPTGIGKTISALYPAIKAMGEGKVERIFYLTARTTARAVAEKALADLRGAGLRVRSLTLTAKEKICLQDGHPCDVQTCPLARGYYDRSKAAMRAVLSAEELTFPVIDALARQHQVCPFELALDLSTWVDVVICDYNYLFDPQVYLRRHFGEEPRAYAFLIDEAHNLVDRSREMFSADLNTLELRQVSRAIKSADQRCARALNKLAQAMRQLGKSSAAPTDTSDAFADGDEPDLFSVARAPGQSDARKSSTSTPDPVRRGVSALAFRDLPPSLLPPLEEAVATTERWLVQNEAAEFRMDLLQLFFRLHGFLRTARRYDERYRTIVDDGQGVGVKLYCVDPAAQLRAALDRGQAAIFFSATLSPLEYYRAVLGGDESDLTLQLASPFPSENLSVLVQTRIRTHFRDRSQSLTEVATAVGALVAARRGNYLVYLPSYQYLTALQKAFVELYPALPVRAQAPGMTDRERTGFLDEFTIDSTETKVGFAVLGGIFGEGIDLVGERLIGVAVVGVGLPPPSTERDLIRDYFEERIGAGFSYAYLFPGMNRVLQAVGRVIRSEKDQGAVLLIDTRFGEWRYRQLFPESWHPERVSSENEIASALRTFWNQSPPE